MTSDEITLELVGQNVNGIHVVKLTDGTLDTTFKHHIYGWRNKKNELIRDPISGKAITTTSRQMLHSNEQRGTYGRCGPKLLKTVPDVDDKRIWWDANPRYVTKRFKNKEGLPDTRKDYVAGKNMVVGTWDEFLEAVNGNGTEPVMPGLSQKCDDCEKPATGGQGRPGEGSRNYCDEHSPSIQELKPPKAAQKKGGRKRR